MKKMTRVLVTVVASLLVYPSWAFAQTFAAVGTRAAGMGGAFVGVADDASAIFWNPAGLAGGAYASLLLDGGSGEAIPDGSAFGAEQSSMLVGLSMPALGLGYYRLHSQVARPPLTLMPVEADPSSRNLSAAAEVRVDSLVTHHAGVTVVQSLLEGVAIGATLKFVRGVAASQVLAADTAEAALESSASDLLGRATNKFDLDVGIMALGGPLKVGLTLRNLREPGFETPGGDAELVLERQARAGVSYALTPGWLAAADFDLLRSEDAFGDRRDVAVGVEGRIARNAFIRSGVRVNTIDDDTLDDARGATFSVGGSYAIRGIFIDGQYSAGSDRGGRGWGIAARFVY